MKIKDLRQLKMKSKIIKVCCCSCIFLIGFSSAFLGLIFNRCINTCSYEICIKKEEITLYTNSTSFELCKHNGYDDDDDNDCYCMENDDCRRNSFSDNLGVCIVSTFLIMCVIMAGIFIPPLLIQVLIF